jgi:hypothetical protein
MPSAFSPLLGGSTAVGRARWFPLRFAAAIRHHRNVRVVAALMLLWSGTALAEQPRGTYTLDRNSLTYMVDGEGQPYPSCGGEKVFGGQSTFVVEYADTILVNQREWRFNGYTHEPGQKKPRPDALVVVVDPQSKDRIAIWFGTDKNNGSASGMLHVSGSRRGKICVDAWSLNGKYIP